MRLLVEPELEYRWQGFIEDTPKRSIALDGYVTEGPRFNPRGPWANFNHHAGVSRLETRATCAQVLIALRQGLMSSFRGDDGGEGARVYVNDCDEDVCLSVFLLQEPGLAEGAINPLLNRLVFMEDMFDTTGGAYPFPQDLKSVHELLWIFAPYHRFRASGKLDERNAGEFRVVIDEVGLRIGQYLVGKTGKLAPDIRYNVIGNWHGWVMIREIGANARLGVYGDGIKAFVAVRERPDGRYTYTLARSSLFVPFPIPKILKALNRREGLEMTSWGGGDMIAGSPRGRGSSLKPEEVAKVINTTLGW